MVEIFFFGNIGGFFSIKIIIDKKFLKLLFVDVWYIWFVFLVCRIICFDIIKNKCLVNDVIMEEFLFFFIVVGILRWNIWLWIMFYEKEFCKKKKLLLRRFFKINYICG